MKHGFGLDHGDVASHLGEPLQREQRMTHVVQHAQVQHHIKLPQAIQIGGHEVRDDGLDATSEYLVSQVKAAFAG